MKQYLEVGFLNNTHGIKGELKMTLWCDGFDYLKQFKTLYLDSEGKNALNIEKVRPQKQGAIIKFKEINSPEEAQNTKGKTLYGNRDDARLPEGRNYILCFKDIAGSDEITVTSDGEKIDFERLDKSGECLKIRFTPKSNESLNEVTVKGAVLSENATPKEAVIDVMSRWETANIKKSTIYRRMRKLESADDFLKAVNGSAMPKIIKKAIEENLL